MGEGTFFENEDTSGGNVIFEAISKQKFAVFRDCFFEKIMCEGSVGEGNFRCLNSRTLSH